MWNAAWLGQFPQVTFKANSAILRIGAPVDFNYYLERGLAAKSVYSEDGEELTLCYYHPGAMLGLHLYRYGRESIAEFIAKDACTCRAIPAHLAQQAMREDSELCYAVLQETLDELDFRIDSATAYVFGGGISVFCSCLRLLAQPQPDGSLLVPKYCTNTELAKFCGLSTVHISRIMTQLQREGVLAREKDGIRIKDADALRRHVKTD